MSVIMIGPRLMYCLCICIIIMLLLMAYQYHTSFRKVEKFSTTSIKYPSPAISFPQKKEFENVIRSSLYFKELTQADLYARKAMTKDEYIERYIASYIDIEQTVKTNTMILLQQCNDILKKFSGMLYSIPWNIVFVSNEIENGYPHTHGDVIILSPHLFKYNNDSHLISTLLHEKVHVFQRTYPDICHKIVKAMGFYKVMKRVDVDVFSRNIRYTIYPRSNPDLDEYVYAYDRKIIIQSYLQDKPKSIADSHVIIISEEDGSFVPIGELSNIIPYYVQQIEHPYEVMACIVPKLANGSIVPSTAIEKAVLDNI